MCISAIFHEAWAEKARSKPAASLSCMPFGNAVFVYAQRQERSDVLESFPLNNQKKYGKHHRSGGEHKLRILQKPLGQQNCRNHSLYSLWSHHWHLLVYPLWNASSNPDSKLYRFCSKYSSTAILDLGSHQTGLNFNR